MEQLTTTLIHRVYMSYYIIGNHNSWFAVEKFWKEVQIYFGQHWVILTLRGGWPIYWG